MKSITMATCAKIGILSLFSFAYAMDKDSIGLNEDVLAIASKGKYSDNMPHVRRLTASEKEKVLGGLDFNYKNVYEFGARDYLGWRSFYEAMYKLELNKRDEIDYFAINGIERGASLHYYARYSYNTGWYLSVVKFNEQTRLTIPLTQYRESHVIRDRLARNIQQQLRYDRDYYFSRN